MKQFWKVMTLLLVCSMLLTGCGGSSGNGGKMQSTDSSAATNGFSSDMSADVAYEDSADRDSGSQDVKSESESSEDYLKDAKLIYRAQLEMETQEFDQTMTQLEQAVTKEQGYFENKDISNYSGSRHGDFVIRVPKDHYKSFLAQVEGVGHITYQSESVENVGDAYYDTELRISIAKTKHARLEKLLSEANSIETIVQLQNALSEVEYEIDRLSGDLRSYDRLIDYSTIQIGLSEVIHLSDVPTAEKGFFGRLADALLSGAKGFLTALEWIVLFFAYNIFWIIIGGAIGAYVYRRKKKQKAEKETKNNQY